MYTNQKGFIKFIGDDKTIYTCYRRMSSNNTETKPKPAEEETKPGKNQGNPIVLDDTTSNSDLLPTLGNNITKEDKACIVNQQTALLTKFNKDMNKKLGAKRVSPDHNKKKRPSPEVKEVK